MPLTVEMVGAIPLIGPPGSNIEGLNCVVKRGFDIAGGDADDDCGVADFCCWPQLRSACSMDSPLMFRQTRIGIHGKPFELLKFRTMRSQCSDTVHREYVTGMDSAQTGEQSHADGTEVFKIGSDERVTRIGRWLRRFSIDELPQLLNVLYGNMS